MARACALVVAALLLGQGATAQGQAPGRWGGWSRGGLTTGGQTANDLTIAEMRTLGLSEEQILKIAEKRRDLEKERAKLEEQLNAARDAAAAANAQVARLSLEVHELSGPAVEKIYKSVMTGEQFGAYERQRFLDQAKQWLRGHQGWLKLTDAQMEDIASLLVPVFEKYARMEGELADARERLADLRRADQLDLAAIDKAEKDLDELSKRNVFQLRQNELMERMRAGLMPDQLEKLDRIQRH